MSFTVTIHPRRLKFHVGPSETVLAAAERQGFTFPRSCQNGACGVCRGRLLRGRVNYGGIGLYGLTEEEARTGLVLLCTARPETDLEIEMAEVLAPGELPIKTVVCQIAAVAPVSQDTWRVLLRPPVFDRPRFLAGQYLFLLMPDGARRAFSIASAPEFPEHLELHIRAMPENPAALAVIGLMRSAPIVRVEMPFGECVIREGERPILMLAGGTGFAPCKAMIESLRAQNQSRPIWLYRGARNRDHLYLRELPQAWADDDPQFRYVEALSESDPAWQGREGLVHEVVLEDHNDLSQFDVYVSGREEMVLAALAAFTARRLPPERFFSDTIDLRRQREAGGAA